MNNNIREAGIVNGRTIHEQVVDMVVTLEYGDIVTHDRLASLIGERRGSRKYNTILTKVSKVLITRQKALENIRNVGYRVTRPENYVDLALSQIKRGRNSLEKAQTLIACTPVDELTPEQVEIHSEVSNRLGLVVGAARTALTDSTSIRSRSLT